MIIFELDNYKETKSQLNSIRKITNELDGANGLGYHQKDDFIENKHITIDLGKNKNQRLLVTRRGKIINADYPELNSKQAVAKAKEDLKEELEII